MPFTRRPDSFLILSGPEPAKRTGNTATSVDSLSGFVSEAEPPAAAAPTVFVSEVQPPAIVAPVVAVSATRDATVGTDATTTAKPRPPIGRPLTLAAAAAAIFIAVASAVAVIMTLLGGSDRPSTNVPPTNAAVVPKIPPSSPLVPAMAPDPRRAVDPVTPDPPLQASPVVATTNRAVGTTGRRTAEPNQATKTSRAAATSYKGSLAIRSAPLGARVFVNGRPVGSTPLVLDDLPVGSRAIRLEADGYERWSASTRIVANQQTRLSATLARAKP